MENKGEKGNLKIENLLEKLEAEDLSLIWTLPCMPSREFSGHEISLDLLVKYTICLKTFLVFAYIIYSGIRFFFREVSLLGVSSIGSVLFSTSWLCRRQAHALDILTCSLCWWTFPVIYYWLTKVWGWYMEMWALLRFTSIGVFLWGSCKIIRLQKQYLVPFL